MKATKGWLERPAVSAAGVASLLLVTVLVLRPGIVDFDPTYAANWGRELLRLESPTYDTPYSPTPHPLPTLLAGLASLLGAEGTRIALWILTCLAFAATVWLAFLLTTLLAPVAAGALAALLTATNVTLMAATTGSVADVWVVALVLLAAYLAAREPARPAAALIALGVAGLHRPEAWVLAAVYWLWLAREPGGRRRLGLAALAAAAPVLWLTVDFAVTGNPLYSLHDTRDAVVGGQAVLDARDPHARRDLDEGLASIPQTVDVLGDSMRDMLRLPGLLGGIAGVVLAAAVASRRSAVIGAPLLLISLTFVGLGVVGLPRADRFLLPMAALLAVFFGFAALGWVGRPPGRMRTAWAVGGIMLTLAAVASIPARARSVDRVRELASTVSRVDADLRRLLASPEVRGRLRPCDRLYTPNYRPKPYVAYYLDRPLAEVVAAELSPPEQGAFVAAASPEATDAFLLAAGGRLLRPVRTPAAFRPVAGNASWTVLVRGC